MFGEKKERRRNMTHHEDEMIAEGQKRINININKGRKEKNQVKGMFKSPKINKLKTKMY